MKDLVEPDAFAEIEAREYGLGQGADVIYVVVDEAVDFGFLVEEAICFYCSEHQDEVSVELVVALDAGMRTLKRFYDLFSWILLILVHQRLLQLNLWSVNRNIKTQLLDLAQRLVYVPLQARHLEKPVAGQTLQLIILGLDVLRRRPCPCVRFQFAAEQLVADVFKVAVIVEDVVMEIDQQINDRSCSSFAAVIDDFEIEDAWVVEQDGKVVADVFWYISQK